MQQACFESRNRKIIYNLLIEVGNVEELEIQWSVYNNFNLFFLSITFNCLQVMMEQIKTEPEDYDNSDAKFCINDFVGIDIKDDENNPEFNYIEKTELQVRGLKIYFTYFMP